MDLNHIQTLVQADFAKVDVLIDQCLDSPIKLIPQVAKHLIHSGGKRLRPLIALLSAAIFNCQAKHVPLAAILELIHTATLLHDDVIDTSSLRRGKKTANTLWGNPASILVGDFLYSRAFQLMVEINHPRVLRSLADATNRLSQAEILQLVNHHNPQLSEADCLHIIEGKTAILFSIAAQQPVVLANGSEAAIAAMAQYGLHLGMAFQLVDDTLDYTGTTCRLGKSKGDDIAEGKTTLPLILALRTGNTKQVQLIEEAITQGNRNHLEAITDILQATGAIRSTLMRAQEQAKKAIERLQFIPSSCYKEALISLAEFTVARTY